MGVPLALMLCLSHHCILWEVFVGQMTCLFGSYIFRSRATTFEELYLHINSFIREQGFVNLDFMGNLGHSIVKHKDDRIYIEKGNQAALSSVDLFTFEPHISIPDSKYGFKKENIYFFSDGKLTEL